MNKILTDRLNEYVVFTLDELRYALPLSYVERVVRAVEVTPLPKAPDVILGVINLQGNVIPVFNVRRRFRQEEKEIELTDQFIIAHTPKRTIALVADAVIGVVERSEHELISSEKILPDMEYIEGILKFEDGMVLIHDLNRFLSLEEEKILDKVMR